MKIVGFVGMPGSGKSVASQVAREMGIKVVVMGDVIRAEAKARGLELTDGNLGLVGTSLRSEEGPEAVARRSLQMVGASDLVVVDGIRSKEEVAFFRAHCGEFHLVEVVASPEARLKRIAARGRSDDPGQPGTQNQADILETKVFSPCDESLRQTAEALEMRECRELGWGMSQAMDEADFKISNDGSLEDFRERVASFLHDLVSNGLFKGA